MTEVRRILWAATVASAGLVERVEAAAATGYTAVSISPTDLADVTGAGRDPGEVRRWAADLGVDLAVLDAIVEWYPYPPPRRRIDASGFDIEAMLRIAEAFGVESLNAVAPYATEGALDIDLLAERFAVLCDRFAEVGMRVHIEFIPWPPVSDVAIAAAIVERAGRGNGGILVDTWHFFRGRPDLAALAAIPGMRIHAVQVSDGAALVQSLVQDTFRHRLLPGDGEFALVELLRVLERTGGLSLVGPEVLSESLAILPPTDAARLAGEGLDRVLATALTAPES